VGTNVIPITSKRDLEKERIFNLASSYDLSMELMEKLHQRDTANEFVPLRQQLVAFIQHFNEMRDKWEAQS
jgi:hypothetical protein